MLIRRRHFVIAFTLIAAIAVWRALDWWIVTDRERIAQLLKDARVAAEKANWKGMMNAISPDYDFDGVNFSALASFAKHTSRVIGEANIQLVGMEIKVNGARATAKFGAIVLPHDENGILPPRIQSRWLIGLKKSGDAWRITSVQPISIAGMRVSSLKDLRIGE